MDYQQKYLKYKNKYLNLKKQINYDRKIILLEPNLKLFKGQIGATHEINISYISGDEDMDRMDRIPTMYKSVCVNFENLIDKFSKYITAYKANTLTDICFNMYNVIGIPDNSYIQYDNQPDLIGFVGTAIARNLDITDKTDLTIVGNNHVNFWYRKGKQAFPGFRVNKIHLQVKHEYILNCVMKLLHLKDICPEYDLQWKFTPWNRESNLRPNDHALREINNGVSGTFVIYGSSDPAIMTLILNELLRLFPNYAEMGLMELNNTHTLTVGHVRLNNMISYSSTDRASLTDQLAKDIAKFSDRPTCLPSWIGDMNRLCTADSKDVINKESQLYIGMDVCDAEGKQIDYERKCNTPPRTNDQNYCYMPETLIDPRTLRR